MMLQMPYGNSQTYFTIPDSAAYEVYRPNDLKPADDPEKEVRRAVSDPIGSPKLEDIIFPGCSVTVICDDMTRPTPVMLILNILIPMLLRYGAEKSKIKIIMALGSHRYMTYDEMRERVGPEIFREFRVLNSEFRNKEKLIYLGRSSDDVEIWVNKDVMDSDVRIGIGNIVPHPAAGWSGGGKIIYPGVTGEDTVARFHRQHGLAGMNMFGMDDCPVRSKMEKWVDTVGLDFIINTVLTLDKKIFRAVAGHYISAHREGIKYAMMIYGKTVTQKSDIVIVSSFPVDVDFWQATKGVMCGDHITNDGGTLILLTPCYEGIGPHKEYPGQIGNDHAEDILREAVTGNGSIGDPLALAVGTTISRIRKRICLSLVSCGITREESEKAGMEYFDSLQEAIDHAIERYDKPRIGVITHGGEMYLHPTV
jgi:lactate racemase